MRASGDWSDEGANGYGDHFEPPRPAGGSPQQQALDLLGILKRRKFIIAFVMLMGLGLGYLYYIQADPIYMSTSQILIVKEDVGFRMMDTLSGDHPYQANLANQMLIIKSPIVVQKAVEEKNLKELRSLKNEPNAIGVIMSNIEPTNAAVRKNLQSDSIMTVMYRGTDSDDTEKVLGAVINSYKEILAFAYRSRNQDIVEKLDHSLNNLHQQLNDEQEKYNRWRKSLNHAMTKNQQGFNLFEARLLEYERRRSQIILDREERASRLEQLAEALNSGARAEALLMVLQRLSSWKDFNADNSIRSNLFTSAWEIELQLEMAMELYGNEHPKVKSLRKQLSKIRAEEERQRGGMEENKAAETDRVSSYIDLYAESLKEEIRFFDRNLQELEVLIKNEAIESKKIADDLIEEEGKKSKLVRLQNMFDRIDTTLKESSLFSVGGGVKAELIYPPYKGVRVEPDLAKVMMIACIVGGLAGFALAYVVDVADKSFRSPDEIRVALAMPIIGHIPIIDPSRDLGKREDRESNIDAIVTTYHRPKSTAAEAYRAVRTALYFSTKGEGHRVVQVTSPTPGDGKTTLTANLAVSIAASGRKVLLIDADCRRPKIHRLFGIDRETGLSSVINGESTLEQAVRLTEVENLYVMSCGPKVTNPSELLTSSAFGEFVEQVRAEFDIVLIDTPPLLAVTDPQAVTPRVDGVVLVIQLNKKTRVTAERSREMLRSIRANILGVVVNGIGRRMSEGPRSYQYKNYHNYQYGPRYNYGYSNGYGYGYGYGEYSHYYHDDDRGGGAPAGTNGSGGGGAAT